MRYPGSMTNPAPDKSDAELVSEILVARAAQHSEEAYRTLVDRYWKVVVVLLKSRCASNRDVEDLAQEAFIRAWRSLERLENPKLFLGWLLRIAQNLATDHLRKRRSETSLDNMDPAATRWGGSSSEVENKIEQAEEWEIVQAALRKIPERYQIVVSLRYLNGMSNKEMARSLGEPEGTIRNRLFRALRKLRKIIETPRSAKT